MWIKKILRRAKNPMGAYKELVSRTRVAFTQRFATLLKGRPFYVQGRMDIDPRSPWYSREFNSMGGGFFLPEDSSSRSIVDLEPWDSVRKDMLVLLLRSINARKIHGHMAEVGVYKGGTAKLFHHYMPDRVLHLFDTFQGFPVANIATELKVTGDAVSAEHFADTTVKEVLKYINPINDNLRVYPGMFPETVPTSLHGECFSFVHLDADLYKPTLEGLKYFYPKVSPGGCIVVHDYNAWLGARAAVDQFFADKPETVIPMPDKSGSILVVKI